jgi:hypothetical protein
MRGFASIFVSSVIHLRSRHIQWLLWQSDSSAQPRALIAFFPVGGARESNFALLLIGIILMIYERLIELYDILPMFVYQVCAEVSVYKIGVGSRNQASTRPCQ